MRNAKCVLSAHVSPAFGDLHDLAKKFAGAIPYPHVVINDFLPLDLAERIHDEVRQTGSTIFASNDITQSKKTACNDWRLFDPATYWLISYFNSGDFISKIEHITGLNGLFGDPVLEGGGVHKTSRGGFLKMHTDFNWNEHLRADRRINVLYYLNKDWKTEMGGELRISNLDHSDAVNIAPLFNRLVIFNTNDITLHGHPDPLMFDDDYPRCSIAMYYYSTGLEVKERWRVKATTTRYVPMGAGDISWKQGSLRSLVGYLLRRFTRF